MSKKTSRIVKLVLILLIGILAVYNAVKPGDNSGTQDSTSGIEQTTTLAVLQDDKSEISTTTEQSLTTESPTTTEQPTSTTEAPTTAGASIDATIAETSKEVEGTEPPTTTEAPTTTVKETTTVAPTTTQRIKESGTYSSKEDVAEYLHIYGHLPSNYITKDEAKDLGWVSSEGNLWEVAPGKSIGGDYFGNYEGLLPKKSGRKYYECDIDFEGSYRGSKRIIFSNDGLIYYTDDHYESFECLYGED